MIATTDAIAAESMPDEERAWRADARAWLLEHTDPIEADTGFTPLHWMSTPEREAEHHHRCGEMFRKLHGAGYGSITVPQAYGGQGGEAWMQRAFAEEAADRDVNTGFYGSITGMAVPALLHFGTEEQKATHLRRMVSGELSWCQLFSEPGAGSDLAGLAARAERDGEGFVINGQKVWNSAAMYADMGILLVRTDPDAVKHAGITFLLFDMRQPGVEVRRLVQANGAGHFAEVFLSDARCPVSDVLGEVNGGWAPTRVVMANESAVIGGAGGDRAAKLIQLARMQGRAQDRVIRQRLADVYTRQLLLGRMSAAIATAARERRPLPIDPSVVKLYVAESRRREGNLAQELLGPAAVSVAHEASEWAMEALVSRYPISIGGGTDEVHHNNLGERALGLPRDVRVDADVAWKDVPRG